MRKIGFIDYYLDEWHANHYIEWIREWSGGAYKVCYAYAEIDCPKEGKLTNLEWCEKYGAEWIGDLEELIEKSDCLMVLAPDDCDRHFSISMPAVASGKPVFIDKTFCNSKEEAQKIFAAAKVSGSPCFSSSAFRFSERLKGLAGKGVNAVFGFGHCEPENYLVHQIEPIAMLMGINVKKVMFSGHRQCPIWQLKFEDGRSAEIHMPQGEKRHYFILNYEDHNETVLIDDDFWKSAILAILALFEKGEEPVAREETIGIMAIREKCLLAMERPNEWLEIE